MIAKECTQAYFINISSPSTSTRLESLFSARGRYFSPSNLRAWKNRPRIFSPYEMIYFSSIFFKFWALDWALRARQFACARKIFSAHYILSNLVQVHCILVGLYILIPILREFRLGPNLISTPNITEQLVS